MSSGIGVNGVPVSTTADCDVCGEPTRLVGTVELWAGEWVCEACSQMIDEGACPLCGVQDGQSDISLSTNHKCHSCHADACTDADAENPAGTWVC